MRELLLQITVWEVKGARNWKTVYEKLKNRLFHKL